jgi:chloramphenicol O-acetyltransferase
MEDYKELVEFLDKKFTKIENDISEFKIEMTEFKNDTIKFQDRALRDLEDLKQEKTVSDKQDKRKTKVLEIHNTALKSNKILSESQTSEIDNLRVF